MRCGIRFSTENPRSLLHKRICEDCEYERRTGRMQTAARVFTIYRSPMAEFIPVRYDRTGFGLGAKSKLHRGQRWK